MVVEWMDPQWLAQSLWWEHGQDYENQVHLGWTNCNNLTAMYVLFCRLFVGLLILNYVAVDVINKCGKLNHVIFQSFWGQ
jgi:hypothetical protein